MAAGLTVLWLATAHLLALRPDREGGWMRASALVVMGVPLLGWLTVLHGPVAGILALALGVVTLRWPIPRVWRRLRAAPRAPTSAEPAE